MGQRHSPGALEQCRVRTDLELYSSRLENNVELKTKVEEDAPILSALQFYVNELCDWHQEVQDMAHRKTLYPKLAAVAKQLGTDFYLVEGDMVSYNGEKWLLLEAPGNRTGGVYKAGRRESLFKLVRKSYAAWDRLGVYPMLFPKVFHGVSM